MLARVAQRPITLPEWQEVSQVSHELCYADGAVGVADVAKSAAASCACVAAV